MDLTVDHVTLAGTDLDRLRDRLSAVGFDPVYGGEHDDGTTHMATVVFRDGSYLEAIAPTAGTDPRETGYWPERIAGDAGPAAWCIRPSAGRDARDVACEVIRSGFAVAGPTAGGRTTPDGRELEWDAVVLAGDAVEPVSTAGSGRSDDSDDERSDDSDDPGDPDDPVDGRSEALPFVCDDRTPREWRVAPHDVHDGPVGGVDSVLVAVDDADAWIRRFRRLAGIASPVDVVDVPGIDGEIHAVPGAPLALVDPTDGSDLAARLGRFGPGPCGFLLSVPDLASARGSYPLADAWSYAGRDAAWFGRETGVLGVVSTR